jgi:hypothetical protein
MRARLRESPRARETVKLEFYPEAAGKKQGPRRRTAPRSATEAAEGAKPTCNITRREVVLCWLAPNRVRRLLAA